MEFSDLIKRAKMVQNLYSEMNLLKFGREWAAEDFAAGFVGDVGDLMKLVLAKKGIRSIPEVDRKLEHELSDCLWSVLVLADQYGIDLENSFLNSMSDLEDRLASK